MNSMDMCAFAVYFIYHLDILFTETNIAGSWDGKLRLQNLEGEFAWFQASAVV
jgi:hypothetical protein